MIAMSTPSDVLQFWFGEPPQISSRRWFRGGAELDGQIRQQFGPLVSSALRGELEAWTRDLPSAVALLVVLDQFTRHVHRGTADMFVGDSRALALATRLCSQEQALPIPHRAAVYLALTHTEDVAVVADAEARLQALMVDPASRGWRRPLKGLRHAARRHLRALHRFGRYPHRNALLGRDSTDDEVAWLAQATDRYVRSVRPHAERKLRILVLHSFRQSGSRLRRRMRKLHTQLEDIAELVYIDAPHAYVPDASESAVLQDDFGAVPDYRHQRCWWNADDAGAYIGCEDSLRFLAEHLPVDGLLGFSQGAAMAGLVAASQASQLRFAICISGFPARSEAHGAWMAPGTIRLPSLHIFGAQDVLVDVDRTEALARCFVEGRIVSHTGGHFFPDLWPVDAIRSFLLPFLPDPVPAAPLSDQAFDGVHNLDDARAQVRAAVDLPALLAYAKRKRHSWMAAAPAAPDAAAPTDAAHRLWLAAFDVDAAAVTAAIQRDDDFRALTRLAVRAALDLPDPEPLLGVLADHFAAHLQAVEAGPVGSAGRAAPRFRSRTERLTGLGKRIAERLWPDAGPQAAAIRYRKRITALARQHRAQQRRASRSDTEWPSRSPGVSVEVTRPRPVPVAAAPAAELQPLFQFLEGGREAIRPLPFPRGTLMPDGRLDLCKQVVGPQGIGPLLTSLEGHPQVERLLLGNNVVGAGGAEQIASFIRSGRSRVRVWYLAGNEFDAAAVAHVCAALETPGPVEVEGLWLKRNPLGPAAGPALAQLLQADTPLQTLDLVNTGLLDAGASQVVAALSDNTQLRHLYLGTNGLQTAEGLATYLQRVDRLESLYVDCNRLGDAGVVALAKGLAASRRLRRLSVASNRIGPVGARALADALRAHPSLTFLNVGWTRATAAVHERGNHMGDEGAAALGEMLERHPALRVLDVSHNDITQRGLDHFRQALQSNTTLVGLRCPQRGKATNPDRMAQLRGLVDRNRCAAGLDASDIEAIRTPLPARQVLSVYRTQPVSAV